MKDEEKGHVYILWELCLYNLESHLSKRIQNCRYKIMYRYEKESGLTMVCEAYALLASQLISFEDEEWPSSVSDSTSQ